MLRKPAVLSLAAALLSACLLVNGCRCRGDSTSYTPNASNAQEETRPAASSARVQALITAPSAPEQPDPEPGKLSPDHTSVNLTAPQGSNVQERFRPPEGYTRIPQEEGSFGQYVRTYPLLPDGAQVLLYDGTVKPYQSGSAAVFALPVIGGNDLQQCADSVMRMYAEYLWHNGRGEEIRFHFVNGFLFDYPTYRAGGRVKFDGNTAKWQQTAGFDDSYEAFERYLYVTFAYSSTLSMEGESYPADIKGAEIGDVFLRAGSPGHVVMVADVCENADGDRAFLLAQGYMPAQQFHVLKNPDSEVDPWYYTGGEKALTYPLRTPEYTFEEGSFRRMTYLAPPEPVRDGQ